MEGDILYPDESVIPSHGSDVITPINYHDSVQPVAAHTKRLDLCCVRLRCWYAAVLLYQNLATRTPSDPEW